ncbi:hypothetical protein VTJ04DRAFT_7995 [Mycothermus thermophilus]|uniref:uncharacterized protein n=1 Tax=Humicola insolens TaxID=85995 RepID=UPI003743BCD8
MVLLKKKKKRKRKERKRHQENNDLFAPSIHSSSFPFLPSLPFPSNAFPPFPEEEEEEEGERILSLLKKRNLPISTFSPFLPPTHPSVNINHQHHHTSAMSPRNPPTHQPTNQPPPDIKSGGKKTHPQRREREREREGGREMDGQNQIIAPLPLPFAVRYPLVVEPYSISILAFPIPHSPHQRFRCYLVSIHRHQSSLMLLALGISQTDNSLVLIGLDRREKRARETNNSKNKTSRFACLPAGISRDDTLSLLCWLATYTA